MTLRHLGFLPPPIAGTGWLALLGALVAGCASNVDQRCYEQTVSELRVCAGSNTVSGVDVSYYQGTVDWVAVKGSGRAFAIARVSDGINTLDNQFARNWRGMKAAGLVRGVYQFFRPSQDPLVQADLLVSQVTAAGGFEAGDLPPVLDLETTDSQSSSVVQARARTWLDRIQARTGRRPIVYTGAFMSATIGTAFAAYPLWVANYGVTCPSMPSAWSQWLMWQSGSTGRVAGITGNVDVDVFNGTLAELHAFASAVAPPTDGGATRPDGGVARPDGGVATTDGGARLDGGAIADGGSRADGGAHADGGTTHPDGGAADGGAVELDAGVEELDGGVLDDGGQGSQSGDACRTQIP